MDGERQRPTFVEWLRGEIEKREWTLRQTALYTKVDKSSLSEYLSGSTKPGLVNIRKLARKFDIAEVELEEIVNPPAKPPEKLALGVGEDEEIQFVDLDKVPLEDREKLRKAILAMVKSFEEE